MKKEYKECVHLNHMYMIVNFKNKNIILSSKMRPFQHRERSFWAHFIDSLDAKVICIQEQEHSFKFYKNKMLYDCHKATFKRNQMAFKLASIGHCITLQIKKSKCSVSWTTSIIHNLYLLLYC